MVWDTRDGPPPGFEAAAALDAYRKAAAEARAVRGLLKVDLPGKMGWGLTAEGAVQVDVAVWNAHWEHLFEHHDGVEVRAAQYIADAAPQDRAVIVRALSVAGDGKRVREHLPSVARAVGAVARLALHFGPLADVAVRDEATALLTFTHPDAARAFKMHVDVSGVPEVGFLPTELSALLAAAPAPQEPTKLAVGRSDGRPVTLPLLLAEPLFSMFDGTTAPRPEGGVEVTFKNAEAAAAAQHVLCRSFAESFALALSWARPGGLAPLDLAATAVA